MQGVYLLKTSAYFHFTEKHWLCRECAPKLVERLSLQVRQLKETVNKLMSTGVDYLKCSQDAK